MTSRSRMSVLAVGVISFLFASVVARDAQAISIDNSVDVEWQNGRYLDEFATVTGGNFLVDSGDLDDVLINVLISGAPNDIEGFRLILYVGASLQDIEQNPAPTQLTLPVGDSFPNSVFPYEVTGSSYSLSVTLSQFQGYDLLPLLPTLAFSLDGKFVAKSSAGSGLPCDQRPPGTICPSWPGQVSVTVTGGQQPPIATPEPSSYALLLIGGASVAALRRRRG